MLKKCQWLSLCSEHKKLFSKLLLSFTLRFCWCTEKALKLFLTCKEFNDSMPDTSFCMNKKQRWFSCKNQHINPLTLNDPYSGCTTPLTSKRCILYIYSTNTGTEYFKHGIYSMFFSLQNAVCFIILKYLVPVLFTLYIQRVLTFKKIILAPKG